MIQATIHRWLRKACIDKHDHPLRFVSLTNGGFYLAPCVGTLRIRIDAQRNDVALSGEAAGIVATLIALYALGHGDHYRRLRAYAGDHVESTTILAAVD